MPSNHLILYCLLLLLPSVFPSIRVFSNESVLHIRWPKYWSFNFNISPSKEYSRLISFRIDWFDLLAVRGTLKYFPAPELGSINTLVLSFLYSPTLTSILNCWKNHSYDLVQFSHSVVSNSLRPMNHSTPGLPVHHQLLEFTQTHVHWVRDAIQSSHPLSSPSPPAPNPSQHQSLF